MTFEVAGRTVQVAGADPRRRRQSLRELAAPEADLRILLIHFPDEVRSLAPGDFHLILAGHLHGGQICIPTPGGKVRLEHLRAPYWEGLFELPVGMLHVSRGLGTSFVPFACSPGRKRRGSRSGQPSRLAAGMAYRLEPVTRASLAGAPAVCRDCVFWQSKRGRSVAKARWAERVEDDWGAWGTLYHGEGDRLLGFVQYGPSGQFPRAYELPAGPPSADSVLVTCAYLVDLTAPWVLQSLFLAAIGEARDQGVKAIETFGYRYPEGESSYERFLVHRTVFPPTSSPTSASSPSAGRATCAWRGSSWAVCRRSRTGRPRALGAR